MWSTGNDGESRRVESPERCGRAQRVIRGALLACAAMAFFAAAPSEAFGQALQPVEPIVDCVKTERTHGLHHIVYFGYRNPNDQPVTLQAGTEMNFLLPTPPDRGQPSVFMPGEHHYVFAVTFPASSFLAWTLDGQRVSTLTASTCGSYGFFRGDWVAGDYQDGDIVTYNNVFYECRPTPVPPPRIPSLQDRTTPPDQNPEWARIEPPFDPVDPNAPPPQPGPAGPQGSEGPQGPQGPQGLPGNQNTFPSAQVYTIPSSGTLRILDANVTPNSMVFVQYVGGGGAMPQVNDILGGEFKVIGQAGKRVHYVVFN
jgi:hypothetical protein